MAALWQRNLASHAVRGTMAVRGTTQWRRSAHLEATGGNQESQPNQIRRGMVAADRAPDGRRRRPSNGAIRGWPQPTWITSRALARSLWRTSHSAGTRWGHASRAFNSDASLSEPRAASIVRVDLRAVEAHDDVGDPGRVGREVEQLGQAAGEDVIEVFGGTGEAVILDVEVHAGRWTFVQPVALYTSPLVLELQPTLSPGSQRTRSWDHQAALRPEPRRAMFGESDMGGLILFRGGRWTNSRRSCARHASRRRFTSDVITVRHRLQPADDLLDRDGSMEKRRFWLNVFDVVGPRDEHGQARLVPGRAT